MALALEPLEFGTLPRVVAVVDQVLPIEKLIELGEEGVGILEFRFDLIDEPFSETLRYLAEVRRECRLPVIGTVRETESNRADRLGMFREILPLVDSVDIEIDARINREVIDAAGEKYVIVSVHDFERTPSLKELEKIVEISEGLGGTITKIAAMASGAEDVTRLLRFTEDHKDHNLVTIAMGAQGRVSRVIAPLFGSLFTYACIGEPVAPGQLQVGHLIEELQRYFPRP